MKAVLFLFDSLNRHWLNAYGSAPVPTPNFDRLAKRSLTFDRSYCASMPCMPARRDIHTARPDFLHRGWGPMEPFDDSMPEMLSKAGVHTHLVTDHYHYFEEGSGNYHTKYDTWEFFRGQEGDPWKPRLDSAFAVPPHHTQQPAQRVRQDFANRSRMPDEASHNQTQTIDAALEFLHQNHAAPNPWFLQVECFDPHEPFFAPPEIRALISPDYDGPVSDWPPYGHVDEKNARALVPQFKKEYAALLTLCDRSLGRILDAFDQHDLWRDTLLIVGTDHGFLLGEHDYLAKLTMPLWEEIAHTPLFVWDPRSGIQGERRQALVQTIDWAPTLLDFFGVATSPHMTGQSLLPVIQADQPIRETAIFGYFGHYLNVTDGRHVLMIPPDPDVPLYTYTLSPAHVKKRYDLERLQTGQPAPPFAFAKGCPLCRFDGIPFGHGAGPKFGPLLYDLPTDPTQQKPLQDAAVEERLRAAAADWMDLLEAPPEQFERYGFPGVASDR